LGEELLALPKAFERSQLQPLLPFFGHLFERHLLNLTEPLANPIQIAGELRKPENPAGGLEWARRFAVTFLFPK